jgi:hypothetical protein
VPRGDQPRELFLLRLHGLGGVNPIKPKHDQYILRGKRAQFAHHDPRPCLMPPDWSKGYTSIFALQQEEEAEIAR